MALAACDKGDVPVIGIVSHRDLSGKWVGYEVYGQGRAYVRSVAMAGGAPLLVPLELGEDA